MWRNWYTHDTDNIESAGSNPAIKSKRRGESVNTTSNSEEQYGNGIAAVVYAILFGVIVIIAVTLGIVLRWSFERVILLSLGPAVVVIIAVTFLETVVKFSMKTIKDRAQYRILRVVGGLAAAALLITIAAGGCCVVLISLVQ